MDDYGVLNVWVYLYQDNYTKCVLFTLVFAKISLKVILVMELSMTSINKIKNVKVNKRLKESVWIHCSKMNLIIGGND